ncbi:hypothetical protein KNO81_39505 [Paraburkholderia sediminicola]|jgi:hypothetical protein|nr:hypothetical protein [Paraburkholderia sediminicola]
MSSQALCDASIEGISAAQLLLDKLRLTNPQALRAGAMRAERRFYNEPLSCLRHRGFERPASEQEK